MVEDGGETGAAAEPTRQSAVGQPGIEKSDAEKQDWIGFVITPDAEKKIGDI